MTPEESEYAGLHRRVTQSKSLRNSLMATVVCSVTSGCMGSLQGPERLVPVATEMKQIRAVMDDAPSAGAVVDAKQRNNVITARKYAIDVQYSEYEAAVIREADLTDFGAKAVTIALNQTASLIPVGHTSRMLTQIATGFDSLDAAYNEKVLRAQLIQNILASMRIARYNQAAVIYANMKCDVEQYPLPMALSDLELYYRAGTVPTGVVKLTQTVAKAENDAKANQDKQKPANSEAKAVLDANKTEATVRAESQGCSGGPTQGQELMQLKQTLNGLNLTIQKQGKDLEQKTKEIETLKKQTNTTQGAPTGK